MDTVMCCHCGMHYTVVPGSGRRRGFCFKCMAPTCGGPSCDQCFTVEQRLGFIEGKRAT